MKLSPHRGSWPAFIAALLLLLAGGSAPAAERLNELFITTDDMGCDSVGAYGAKLDGITPNMDRLAGRSLRFSHAFVQVGKCMPSRNVMFSGRHPHNNRVEGFYPVRDPGYPVMADIMQAGGCFTGVQSPARSPDFHVGGVDGPDEGSDARSSARTLPPASALCSRSSGSSRAQQGTQPEEGKGAGTSKQ